MLRKKFYISAWIVVFIFAIVFLRYFYLQIIRANEFQEKVAEQRIRSTYLQPERGKIIDRNGSILAMSLMAQDISVNPNVIQGKDVEKVSKVLSDTLDMPYDDIYKIVSSKKNWVPIAKRVEPDKAFKIKEKNIYGIEILPSPKRYYPNGSFGGTFLGSINFNNEPLAGIELSLNDYLSGIPGYNISEVSSKGKPIPIGFKNISTPQNGQDVQLSIDSYMQYVLENRLKQGMKEMHPKSIHGIIMDPNTGEILAMASYPSFDPNNYAKSKPNNWTRTPANFVFEPGSIMKPIYMAMALDHGYINENTSWYDSSGAITVNGTSIHNDRGEVYGKLDLRSIIVHSSNVGMIHISQQMTSQQIVNGLSDVGIGKKTGIELPGEEMGIIPTVNMLNNDPLMKATESFGQGIAVTPVQMISAFSSIINGGHRVNAKLVKEIKDNYGNVVYSANDQNPPREFKARTSELMKSYLNANMHDGTGKSYQLDGYEAGGKTGSAWVVDPKTHAYKNGIIIGSFMGFAPLKNPKFVVLITVDEPKDIGFGALSAGPIWHDVMSEILRYSNAPKEKGAVKESTKVNLPDTDMMTFDSAKALIEDKIPNVKVENAGNGEVVVDQIVTSKNNEIVVSLQTKQIKSGNFYYIPDLSGKTKKEVESIFSKYKFQITFHGTGKVVEQNVSPGQITSKEKLTFWLE